MAKFQKSKFRNGQRISNDAKWTAVDMRSAGAGYRPKRRKSSGIFGKALGNAVRKAVRESLKTPQTPRYRTSKSYAPKGKTVEDAHNRTTLTISEMPEELRYLSYPHLKRKPQPKIAAPTIEVETVAEQVPIKEGTYWELLDIVRQFILDIFGKTKPKN